MLGEVSEGYGAPVGQEVKDAAGGDAELAVAGEAGVAVRFGEAAAVGSDDEGEVVIAGLGLGECEGVVEEDLSWGGVEEVVAADDVGDVHVGVIDDDGELIGGGVVGFGDDEVAELLAGEESLRAAEGVGEFDGGVGDEESDGGWSSGEGGMSRAGVNSGNWGVLS